MTLPRLLLVLALCMKMSPALADDNTEPRQYDIELLIFQHLNPNDGGEAWPIDYSRWLEAETGAPENTPDAATDPLSPSHPPEDNTKKPVQWIPPQALQLQAEAGALRRAPGYRVLQHLGWRQTVLDRNHARPLDLPATERRGVSLNGSVKVAVERYLHLYLNLHMSDTNLPESGDAFDSDPVQFELPEFRLDQHRRMRSRELHYFDHPRFGVLARITPVNADPDH
ncbi:MAG TPA: hypothetical protein ENJ79_08915 [Gammaproteobacteria bacterium]|nr:hypothetical protein [Gammaproteobacteria bacterium]